MSRHSRGFSNWLAEGCLVAGMVILTGCGGGGSSTPPPPPPPPTLSITTASLTDGVQSTAYSVTVQATGGTGTQTWSVASGALPDGLSLSAAGAISGTPTAAGTFNFTVNVVDQGTPQQSASQALSIQVATPLVFSPAAPPGGNPGDLPGGTNDAVYSQTLTATGGVTPYTWSVTAGSLPPGLTIDPATGTISGTPTQGGPFMFTVQVQDSTNPSQTATFDLIIVILKIDTTSLLDGVTGVAYSQTVVATGGTAPIAWFVSGGALPGGLNLGAATGVINGTPAAVGAFNFTVQATDSSGTPLVDTQALSIQVASPLSITTTTLPDGNINVAYSQTLASTGGTAPIMWALAAGSGPLPGGLTLNGGTGTISGTPSATGAFNFTVEAQGSSNPAQVVNQALSITIIDTLVITTTTLPNGAVNTAYSQTLAATGGTTPYSWVVTVGAEPVGITLAADGTLSGTPTVAGTSNFTVQATDSSGTPLVVTQDLSLTINAVALGRNDTIATATPLSNGRVAASISPYPAPGSVDKPDVDVYEITGTAGATVTIEIFAMRLTPASPLDPMIQIVDVNGVELTTCNDGAGNFTAACFNDDLTLGVDRDSRLELQVPAGATTFFVRVMSWSGGARPDFLYEIEITGAN